MRKKYYSFIEYCEDMEISIPCREDYYDYIAYCEMNNYRHDIL